MTDKVKKLAEDIKTLSPEGQAAVGIIIDAAWIHTEGGQHTQTSIVSKHEMLDMINDADWKMAEQKNKVTTTKEIAADELESMPEWKIFDDAQKAYELEKEKLRIATLGNGKYNNQKERVHQEEVELKSRREILSSLLVRYAADYRVQSVEVDDTNRVIVLSGRIGRKLKRNQSELPL